MKYRALATDYDGTIAHDGRVDAGTIAALEHARTAGLRLLLVTGRELSDLANTFDRLDLIDRVVAENGAVLSDPAGGTLRTLAAAPPPGLVDRLTRANVPVSIGHSIIATSEPHEQALREAIRESGADWHLIFNKGSVMALPSGVTKATGMLTALQELHILPEETVGVGDAENDLALLAASGLGVAVANALPSLKQAAALVTAGERGAGVAELIAQMLSGSLARPSAGGH